MDLTTLPAEHGLRLSFFLWCERCFGWDRVYEASVRATIAVTLGGRKGWKPVLSVTKAIHKRTTNNPLE